MPTKIQIDTLKREIPAWIEILKNNGFTAKQISFTLPQMITESMYFASNSYLQDLNPLGIKYRPLKPSPDTTQGRKSSEFNIDGSYYARFNNKNALAKEYKRILSLQRAGNKIGKPIDAIDFVDFNNRLYDNGYYEKTLKKKREYLNNLIGINTTLKNIFPNYLEMLQKKNSLTFLTFLGVLFVLGTLYIKKIK